jgi:hypothetical protein
MSNIEQIYELIKNDNSIKTLENNEELFKEFYYHNMQIGYYGIKVIEIYKYLLSLNLDEENEKYPYINSKIIEDFNNYEQKVTQWVYQKDRKPDDSYVEILYNLIDNYNFFKKYKTNLYKIIDEKKFIRDYTAAMIIILNKSFFEISKENILKMHESIKNNDYLKTIFEDNEKKELLDKDYIFEYCSRYLFTKQFSFEENIKEDMLLKNLKDGKIKDKNVIKKILKNTDSNYIMEAFGNDLKNLIDMIEKITEDEYERKEIFNVLLLNLHYKDDFVFDLIIEDERVLNYINEEDINKTIDIIANEYPAYLTEKQIIFLLKNKDNALLKINAKENLKNNNWSKETIEFVKEKTKNSPSCDISLEESINNLDKFFKGENLNDETLIACVKALIKNISKNALVYQNIMENVNGNYINYNGIDIISININLYKQLIQKDFENNPLSLKIFETAFHEVRHLKQQEENFDEPTKEQIKEQILTEYNSPYYKKNYYGISYEKDARVNGALTVALMLEKYFPYMKNCINFYKEKSKEENKIYNEKEIFELSEKVTLDEAIEKLVAVNPKIKEKYKNLEGEKYGK